jgi:UDP-glucose 4-epimerase
VWGDDYPTPDGTGIRDYIHVMDLAAGHLKALEKLQTNPGLVTYNLGNGRGYSVMEVIRAFEKASGRKIPYKMMERRPGDVAKSYADPSKANRELNWHTSKSLDDMCRDAWLWQSQNPDGYGE